MSILSKPSIVSCVSLGAVLLSAASCGIAPSGLGELKRAEIPGSISNQLSLGQSYDSHRATWGNIACVTGEVDQTIISPSATVSYSRDLSYDKVLKIIAGDLDAGVKFPSVTVDAKAYYASDNSTTDYRETHTLSFKYTVKNKFKLGSVVPSGKGASYIAKSDTILMRDRCKNEFVNEIDTGLVYLANMNVDFESAADKQYFGGSLDVNVLQGTVSVKGKLAVADEKDKKRVKISLRAMQDGGEAEKIAAILTPEVASCDAANLAPCVEGFQKLIAYGNTLTQQIASQNGTLKVLSYHTESYQDTGVDELVPPAERVVPKATIAARNRLESLLRDARQAHSRISHILGSSEKLSGESLARVKKARAEIEANRERLGEALELCYANPYAADLQDHGAQDCAKVAEETEQGLYVIDHAAFDVPLAASAEVVPPSELCAKARQHVIKMGWVSALTAKVFAVEGKGPKFKLAKDWNSGIAGWGKCEEIVSQL